MGSTIALPFNGLRIEGKVVETRDPSFLGVEHDRVPRQHESRMKDFRPLRLGVMELNAGRGLLTLRAVNVPGKQVREVRTVMLTLMGPSPALK